MKCNKCGAEWKVDASRSVSITVCPFCQEKIVAKKSGDWRYFDNTKELLAYVAAEYGNDALFGRKHFTDHTSPSMPQGQRNLVKQAFECGAVKILQDNANSDQAHKEIAVKQAIGKLIDTYASAKEAAGRVVWEFTNAIGWGMLEPTNNSAGYTAESFTKRGYFSLEDSEWDKAAGFFDNALNIDPDYAPAYLGLLCVDLKVSSEGKLANVKDPRSITNHNYYKRTVTDPAIKAQLEGYIQIINARIDAEQKAAAAKAERKRKATEEAARKKRVQDAYDNACMIMHNAQYPDDYRKAIIAFGNIDSNYQDINSKIDFNVASCVKQKTVIEEAEKTAAEAKAERLQKLIKKEQEHNAFHACVSTGYHTVCLRKDGTVLASGGSSNQCNVQEWRHIIAISASHSHTVGLKADGTVVAVGLNDTGQCNVADWQNITAISAGEFHTVGLNENGSVLAVGCSNDGECDTKNWHDVIAVYATYKRTIGLTKAGNVVVSGVEKARYDSTEWQNIRKISKCGNIGIKNDYTLIGIGECRYVINQKADIWQDIITAVNTDEIGLFGLKENGTISTLSKAIPEVHSWRDIVDISAGYSHIVGLKKDGTVVAAGGNYSGQCDVSDWENIIYICADAFNTIGLKSNGTIVITGHNSDNLFNITWHDIGPANKEQMLTQIQEERKRLEEAQRQRYNMLIKVKENASSESKLLELSKSFRDMNGYKDTVALASECDSKYQLAIDERRRREIAAKEEYYMRLLENKDKLALEEITEPNLSGFCNLAEKFRQMSGYKNAQKLSNECLEEARSRQSKLWESQGLCRYCGCSLGLFKKCKSKICGQKN